MAQRSESRFGFGQLAGSAGVLLLVVGVSQPWLRMDGARAFAEALQPNRLDQDRAGQILYVFSGAVSEEANRSPQAIKLARDLGVGATGWDQNHFLAGALLAAALIATIGIVRSVAATSAWGARSKSPLLALAGLAGLGIAAAALWLAAPEPKAAMRPELGLWLVTGGALLLLLGALTLGNNRRRPWIDELEADRPSKSFDNTEHLAYSHGAWVPKLPDDK